MQRPEISVKIVEIFNRTRAQANAPYEEENFLRFLFDPPQDMNAARNSFKSLRRLNRFLHHTEAEFGIAFTNDEWGKNWTLAQLAEAIAKKLDNPKAHLKFIEKRCKQARSESNMPLLAVLVILVPIVSLLYKIDTPVWLIGIVAAIPPAFLIYMGVRSYRHYQAVMRRFRSQFPGL